MKRSEIFLDREAKKSFIIDVAYISVVFVLCYIASKFLLQYLFPFLVGAVLAAIIYKPADFVCKKLRIKASAVRVLLVILFILAVILLGAFVISRLIKTVGLFFDDILNYIPRLTSLIDKLTTSFKGLFSSLPPGTFDTAKNVFLSALNSLAERLSGFFSSFAATTAKNAPSFLISVIITIAASCYIAKDFDRLKKFLKELIPIEKYNIISQVKGIAERNILKAIKGYLIISSITFAELSVALLLLRVKYAVALAAVIALIDILPVLGTGTILLPWAIFSFLYGKTFFGIALILIYLIITVVRNLLEPKIIASQLGISPLFTLIFIFLGYKIFGVFGMFLLPVIMIIVIEYYKKQIREQNNTL